MNIHINDVQQQLDEYTQEIAKATELSISDANASPEALEKLLMSCLHLQRLSIINHRITTLPNLKHCTSLSTLNLICLKLKDYPKAHFPLQITTFSLTKGDANYLPDYFWQEVNIGWMRLLDIDTKALHIPSAILSQSLEIRSMNMEQITFGAQQTNLTKVRIFSSILREIDASFSHLIHLSQFQIEAPIQAVHCDFSVYENLEYCSLWYCQLTDYSFLKKLTNKLLALDIRTHNVSWTGLPNMHDWAQLQRIHLEGCADTTLASAPIPSTDLYHVELFNCQLTQLPETLQVSPRIRKVELTNLPSISLANSIKYWSTSHFVFITNTALTDTNIPADHTADWVHLTLNNNDTTFDNLDFLDQLPALKKLDIAGNNTIPSPLLLLRKKTVPVDYLVNIIPNFKYKKVKEFSRLCSSIAKTKLPEEDQAFFVNYFAGRTNMTLNKRWNWATLLKASHIGLLSFKKKWQTIIDQKVAADVEAAALSNTSIIYVTGKIDLTKKALKKQVETLGMQLATAYSDAVTHVIIGRNSPDYDVLADKDFVAITSGHLQHAYANEQPQFLKETIEQEETTDMLNNLQKLLRSHDESNVQIATEMIKSGGLPTGLIDTILVAYKTAANAKIKKVLKKLLEIHTPVEWKPVFRDRLSFKAVHDPNKSELDIRRQFAALAKRVKPAEAAKFARLMFRETGRGLRYAITAGLAKSVKKEGYKEILNDHHLDFSKGLGFPVRRELDYSYEMPQTSVSLPVLALDIDTIYSLNLSNCRYDYVPTNLPLFKDLKHLDFSINELRTLPDLMVELAHLETLDLSDNSFTQFPEILFRMPALQKVNLRGNKLTAIPEQFKTLKPACVVEL